MDCRKNITQTLRVRILWVGFIKGSTIKSIYLYDALRNGSISKQNIYMICIYSNLLTHHTLGNLENSHYQLNVIDNHDGKLQCHLWFLSVVCIHIGHCEQTCISFFHKKSTIFIQIITLIFI